MKKILFLVSAVSASLSLIASERLQNNHFYKVVNGVKRDLEQQELETLDVLLHNFRSPSAISEEWIRETLQDFPDFLG